MMPATNRSFSVPFLLGLAAFSCGCFLVNDDLPKNRIRLTGNIELTEVDIAFKVPGRVVEIAFDEGDEVPADALVARLDTASLEREREKAVANIESIRARMDELEAVIRFQQENMEAQQEQRRAEIRQAKAQLEALLRGSREQEIEEAEAAVERARAQFEHAEGDWKRAQPLYANEDISEAQYGQFRAAYETSRAALKQAEEKLALVREGPRTEDIEQGRASVQRAEAGLRQANALQLEVERNRKAMETLRAELKAGRAQLDLIDTEVEDMSIRSPISGRVLTRSVEEGEVIASGTAVLKIGNLVKPWVRGFIDETDLGVVRLGAPVEVRTDSYPGKVYRGRVSFISSEAEFTPKQIQTPEERVKLVYRVKVDVENENQELKLNMPVDADILLEGGR